MVDHSFKTFVLKLFDVSDEKTKGNILNIYLSDKINHSVWFRQHAISKLNALEVRSIFLLTLQIAFFTF